MFVLSRKSQESVVIGRASDLQRGLRVTVLDIRGGRVKLGFEADPDVSIRRSELPDPNNASFRPTSPAEAAALHGTR
jgi:carbon storage regulator CsrA